MLNKSLQSHESMGQSRLVSLVTSLVLIASLQLIIIILFFLFTPNWWESRIPVWNSWIGNASVLLGLWLSSGLFSFGIVFAVRQWASHHLLDIPNERSSHSCPTPRGGGVGIVIMTLFPLGLWLLIFRDSSPNTVLVYVITSGMVAAVGWIDDCHSLPAKKRLVLHFLFASTLVAISGVVSHINIPFLGVITLGSWVGFFVSVVWIVGFTNIHNFMDGIDGLAGIQAVVASMAWCLLLLIEGQVTLALLAGLVAAASFGFLLLNAPPALIFMGDVGSTFLGFTLAALPILAYHQLQNPRLLITGIMLVAPFVFDSSLTILRRALNHENILKPHRSHLYQRLAQMQYSHRWITGLYMLLCMISALCGLLYYAGSDVTALVAVIGVIVLCVLLATGVTWEELKHQRKMKLGLAPLVA